MPRVILTLRDEEHYGMKLVLRSDKGLATILSALAGAVRVDGDETYKSPPRIILGKELMVQTEMVTKSTRFCVREGEAVIEVDEPETRQPKRAALNGRKPLALAAPSAQLGLRLGNGGRP